MQETVTAALGQAQAQIDTTSTALTNLDSSFAQYQQAVTASFAATNAQINSVSTTLSTSNTALSNSVQTVETSLNGLSATVTQNTTSIDGVRAQHGIWINNNGAVGGYALTSALADGSGPITQFLMDVDAFRVGKSDAQGGFQVAFQVSGGQVVMRSAMIEDLSVETIKIANQAVTVPVSASGSLLTGNGAFQLAARGMVYFSEPGSIEISWAFDQGYSATGPTWGYRVSLNGATVKERVGMGYGNDQPSSKLSVSAPAGWNTVDLYWMGQNSGIVALGSLSLLGVKR